MVRILIMLLVALLPTLILVSLIIWALGSFGYTPLQPLAQAIGHVAEPVVTPVITKIKSLIGSLPGGPNASL